MKKAFFLTILIAFDCLILNAQEKKDSKLYLEMKTQDSVFFERAFNLCDMPYLEGAIHKDLMFFHDKAGIQTKADFLQKTRDNICGDLVHKLIRKRVENSLEVFALYNNEKLYGAIQTGVHRFYIREAHKKDVLTGEAKFTHVWILVDGKWLLREVLSFDHQGAK